MKPYNIKIVTPEKVFYDGETEQIVVKTTEGNVGILAGHTDYVASLPSGPLMINIDGKFKIAAISDGMIKVSKGGVIILAVAIEWAEDIDIERAKIAEKLAREKLETLQRGKEFDIAEFELKRAVNRINIAEK